MPKLQACPGPERRAEGAIVDDPVGDVQASGSSRSRGQCPQPRRGRIFLSAWEAAPIRLRGQHLGSVGAGIADGDLRLVAGRKTRQSARMQLGAQLPWHFRAGWPTPCTTEGVAWGTKPHAPHKACLHPASQRREDRGGEEVAMRPVCLVDDDCGGPEASKVPAEVPTAREDLDKDPAFSTGASQCCSK